ncbi:hypothetical protein ATPR_2851 [Acetobacter tropicalis NBRC 101654]|uniref:Uncharacterized protein n=1 Tax=Acetobacter tropicalis NBRC 101654 TaxID=749388 RepID=F7VHK1_9PROT|nr:hypothetical protein ATPR_2851 [Acetobacter tropicalis NBRC 101654]
MSVIVLPFPSGENQIMGHKKRILQGEHIVLLRWDNSTGVGNCRRVRTLAYPGVIRRTTKAEHSVI